MLARRLRPEYRYYWRGGAFAPARASGRVRGGHTKGLKRMGGSDEVESPAPSEAQDGFERKRRPEL